MVLTRSQPGNGDQPNSSSSESSMAPNKTSDEPGETSPGMQSAMLKAIRRTSNALEEALNRLSHSRSSEPPSVVPPEVLNLEDYLPTFSGDPDEGPEYFVQRLEEYFTDPSNSHRRRRRIMTHYGVEGHFSALYETFQRGHVERYEDFEVFCARQEALYGRLFSDAPESWLVSELVKQLSLQRVFGKLAQDRAVPISVRVSRISMSASRLPRVSLQLGSREMMAAVDSNSTVNWIAARLSPTPGHRCEVHLELATKNETTLSMGIVYVDIVVNDITYPGTRLFVVPDLRDDVILGHEWLETARASVCYAQQCMHHGTHRRSTTYWKKTKGMTPVDMDSHPLPELQHQFSAPHLTVFLETVREFVGVMDASAATGNVRAVTHKIRLEKDEPFRIRPYHLNEQKKCALYECVNEILTAGVVERSDNEYCSPVVLVKKKDGTVRFCTDYRRLNALTKDEAAPLPRIQEVLRDFGIAQVFSSLDLKSGYWQITTAFATPDAATYQYRVMPFGLKNAPATFQKLMACVLSGLLGKCAHVYLDDIIVWSATYEEHIGHLRQVFGLRCAPKKCHFGVSELPYLGHIVGRDGNRPQERHLVQIRDAVPPRTKKQLQRFLGLANWVSEYVPLFAAIAAPLTDLLVMKKTCRWSDAAQKAFDKLKTAIDLPLVLHRPDASREYVLQTGASGIGVAAVLYQERNGVRNIISYSSARFNDAQRRYHINEQECLAVVFAIKKYRPYLEDKPFLLRTDNKCLLWLNGAKDSNAKLTRWSLLLQEFNFRIEHCLGKNNGLPDVLSRQPEDVEREDEATTATERVCAIDVPTLMDEVKGVQLADSEFPKVLERWRRIHEEGPQEPGERKFAEIYDVVDGHLVKRDSQKILLWVPEAARERVLHEFHDVPEAGHPGYEETLRSILGWPTASGDVRTNATTKRGPIQPEAPLRAYEPERPWQTIAVDFMGPYATTREGNKYILFTLYSLG
ncbi:hypothetical protein MTP99_002807 [Tenebrio molitor]|nr:hypothetical protein MTP99_002807 [Tenebrio molitor]